MSLKRPSNLMRSFKMSGQLQIWRPISAHSCVHSLLICVPSIWELWGLERRTPRCLWPSHTGYSGCAKGQGFYDGIVFLFSEVWVRPSPSLNKVKFVLILFMCLLFISNNKECSLSQKISREIFVSRGGTPKKPNEAIIWTKKIKLIFGKKLNFKFLCRIKIGIKIEKII